MKTTHHRHLLPLALLTLSAFSLQAFSLSPPAPAATPAFTTQPAPATVTAGQPATFTAAARDLPFGSQYQWTEQLPGSGWKNLNESSNGNYKGVNTATLAIVAATTALNGAQYRCNLNFSGGGGISSNTATLTVIAPSAPTYIKLPTNQTVTAGQTATFTVTATGNPAPAYSWRVQPPGASAYANIPNAAPYSGVTTPTLTIINTPAAFDGSHYCCLVTNTLGNFTTPPVTLTINPAPGSIAQKTPAAAIAAAAAQTTIGSPASTIAKGVPLTTTPAITKQPADTTINSGQTATFSVTVAGNPAPACQWQRLKAGVWEPVTGLPSASVSGEQTPTLTIKNAILSLNGYVFRCVATNNLGSIASNTATLNVHYAPIITQQPPPTVNVPKHQTVPIHVAATANPPATYQWQQGDPSTNQWNDIPAAGASITTNPATLTITNANTDTLTATCSDNTTSTANRVVTPVGLTVRCVVKNPQGAAISAPTHISF